jgi:beta-lactam-binding protein with PASTA domain
MPKVTGMTVDEAKAEITKAGFTIEKLTEVVPTADPACTVGLVCRQYPLPLHSHRETTKRSLVVGAEPASPPAPTPPGDKGGKAPGTGEKKRGDFDF